MKQELRTTPSRSQWLMALTLSFVIFLFAPLPLVAQVDSVATRTDSLAAPALRFGYLSYEQALRSLPDYALVQQSLADLRRQYDAEVKRVEDDFNRKYEEFLDGQKEFPPSILKKRQSELQDMMQRNVDFKRQSRADLRQAETDAMRPLRQQLSALLADIGRELGLAFIINTDGDACPYVDPLLGLDVSGLVLERLQP